MDVEDGLCWNCEEEVEVSVTCAYCEVAVYCSEHCMKDDVNLHHRRECLTISPRDCSNCSKAGRNLLGCTGCYTTFYCDRKCQRKNFKDHKAQCAMVKQQSHQIANELRLSTRGQTLSNCRRSMSNDCNVDSTSLPFALDLLRLPKNELMGGDGVNFRELKILTLADSFLATFMFSAFSLPDDFDKAVSFQHFERQISTAARDVLFLYIIVTRDGTGQLSVSEILPTLWFSLRLPADIAKYLKDTLGDLSVVDFQAFCEKMRGKITLTESNFNTLQEIWTCWRDVNCGIGSDGCVTLEQKRRRALLLGNRLSGVEEYREFLPELHIPSVDQWFANGNFVPPSGVHNDYQKILSQYNPLFTEAMRKNLTPRFQTFPKQSGNTAFAIRSDWLPFKVFDYNVMKKAFDDVPISAVELIHRFTTKMMLRLETLFDDDQIKVDLKLYEENAPQIVCDTKFDRVLLPSHVTDKMGISRLLDEYADRVNGDNPFTVVIMESTKWYSSTKSEADEQTIITDDVHFKSFQYTTYLKESHALSLQPKTTEFVTFLRGEYLAYQQSKFTDASKDLPKLTDVFERSSKWQLRDFRKKRNRVVPFMFRVHPRSMNNLSGQSRFLEWRYGVTGN